MKRKTPKTWTSQEDLVRQVEALRATGISAKEACKQVGCQYTYFYAIKKNMKAKALAAPIQMTDMSFEDFVRLKLEYEKIKGGH